MFPFLSTKRGSTGTGSSQTQRVISKQVKKKLKKGGLRGSKNDFFEKYFQNRKGLQKLGTKHVPHAPKEDFQKKSKF